MAKQQIEQDRNWYVIHTYSGYEDAVAKNLKQRIESLGMEDKIFQEESFDVRDIIAPPYIGITQDHIKLGERIA